MATATQDERDTTQDAASVIEIFGAGGIIVQRTIPIQQDGGITVLKGECGSGKTTSLDAVKTLLGNRVPSLTPNDTLGKGYVRGFGAEVKIGKQVRRSGVPLNELEVQHIEDRFDLSQIVDPGMKDPEANDAVRLRAIVQNSGVTIDPEEFTGLVPENIDIDLSAVENSSDPVEMASKFKRAVQAHALAIEKEAKPIQERATACQLSCEGVDLLGECDAEKLSEAYSQAVTNKAKLMEQRGAAQKMAESVKRAESRIADLNASYTGTPIELAEKEVEKQNREVELARELLEAAKKRLEKATSERSLAEKERDRALDHETALNAMKLVLDEADSMGSGPSDEEIEVASQAAQAAGEALSIGEAVRNAKSKHAEMLELTKRANLLIQQATSLRETAAQSDEVLSKAITVPGVSWYGSRMLYETDGNKELFDRLSEGQRWRVAVDTAVIGLGELNGDGTRLSVLKQEAWQALDTKLRDHVYDLVKAGRINIVTGEVSDGPLRAEIYERSD